MRPIRPAVLALAAVLSLGCDAAPKATLVAPEAPLALESPASDGVRVYQFRTEEDPAVTGAADFCASAPFTANVRLNASEWSVRTRASDGRMVNQDARRIG